MLRRKHVDLLLIGEGKDTMFLSKVLIHLKISALKISA